MDVIYSRCCGLDIQRSSAPTPRGKRRTVPPEMPDPVADVYYLP
jgi:hypothetical protein